MKTSEIELTLPDEIQPVLRRFLPGDDHFRTLKTFYDQIALTASYTENLPDVHLLPNYLGRIYEKFVGLLNLSISRPKFYDFDNGNYRGSVFSMYKILDLLSDALSEDQEWQFGIRTRNSGDKMTAATSRTDMEFNQVEYEAQNRRVSVFWHSCHPTEFKRIGKRDWFPFSSQVRSVSEKDSYSEDYVLWLSFTVKRMRLRYINGKNRFDYMPDSLTPLPGYDNQSEELFRGSKEDCVRLQQGILDDMGLEKLHKIEIN